MTDLSPVDAMTNPYRAMCAELVDAILTPNPYNWEDSLHDSANRARALLARPAAVGVLPLKERPDFIAGYGEGLADGRRIIEREEAERRAAVPPVAEGPTDEELLRMAASAIKPYESSGIALGEYEPETECAVEVYSSELIAFARAVLAKWGNQ